MAGNVAAATAPHRRQISGPAATKAEQIRQRARRSLVRKRDARRRRALDAFDRLATATTKRGYLPDRRVEEFLEASLLVPRAKLHPDAVQLVRDTARKEMEASGAEAEAEEETTKEKGGGKREGEIPENCYSKCAMMAAFDKYESYLRRCDEIDTIFSNFDRNGDGRLSRNELRKALQERERLSRTRAVKGVVVALVVTYDDVDFILENADADKTGTISRAELLPAIAAWEDLAECRLEEMAMKKGCLGVCTVM